MNEALTAVILGTLPEERVTGLAHFGADRILFVEHPDLEKGFVETHTQVLSHIIEQQAPGVVLCINSLSGEDLVTRVAARLETGLATCCDNVTVSEEKLLLQTRPVFGGQASATYICPAVRPQIAAVSPDALESKSPDRARTAHVERVRIDATLEKEQVLSLGLIKGDPRTIPLTEAEIIVDGGRGMGSREGFKLVEELADVVGGSVGATRMAVDEGWTTPERQIGQTGKTLKPKLLLTCGVSGALHHTMGIKEARLIVAINQDRNAPIFNVADVAVVGDVLQLLPVLISQLREVMAKNPEPGVNDVVDIFHNS
jgi:electron transfer flavoprotein alpha subunit